EAGQAGAAGVDSEVGAATGGGRLETQALEGGQARLDLAQEQAEVDLAAGGEALGDGEGELVDRLLAVVGAAEGLEQRGLVAALSPALEQKDAELARERQVGVEGQIAQLAAILDGVEVEIWP